MQLGFIPDLKLLSKEGGGCTATLLDLSQSVYIYVCQELRVDLTLQGTDQELPPLIEQLQPLPAEVRGCLTDAAQLCDFRR